MPQDYYLVLGITADAGQADIKAAYRRLAKKFRPGARVAASPRQVDNHCQG